MDRSAWRALAVILAVVQGITVAVNIWQQASEAGDTRRQLTLASQMTALVPIWVRLARGAKEGERTESTLSDLGLIVIAMSYIARGFMDLSRVITARTNRG